jgi:hypothetical protein
MPSLNVLAAAALAFASAGASAQDTQPADVQSGSDSGTPQQGTTHNANQAKDSNSKEPLSLQSSGPETWNMVKGHETGSIAKADAVPNSWLATNFAACDKDGNGKVTESEYTACQKAQK